MATISETVTTTNVVDYETPIFLKNGDDDTFWKVYSGTRMLQVINSVDVKTINDVQYPNGLLPAIADGVASDEIEFDAALDAVVTYYKALGDPS